MQTVGFRAWVRSSYLIKTKTLLRFKGQIRFWFRFPLKTTGLKVRLGQGETTFSMISTNEEAALELSPPWVEKIAYHLPPPTYQGFASQAGGGKSRGEKAGRPPLAEWLDMELGTSPMAWTKLKVQGRERGGQWALIRTHKTSAPIPLCALGGCL